MNARSWAVLLLTLAACRSQLSNDPGGGPDGRDGAGTGGDGGGGSVDGGSCAFSSELYYPAVTPGLVLTALSTGDLNQDGHLDVVAAGGSSLVVWPGLADGGLGTATEYVTQGATSQVQVADFNADGFPDIAVLDREPQNASQLFPGQGSAGLLAPEPGPGFAYVTGAVTGDFDRDGYLDWALSTSNAGVNGDVALLLNPISGSSPFSRSILLDSVNLRGGIATADFTQDGLLDLVVSDPVNQTATVFAGQGDGGFAIQPPVSAGLTPTALAAGDVTGDGRVDAVSVNGDDLSLHVFAQVDGGLTAGVRIPSVGGHPRVLATGAWSGTTVGVVTGETSPSAVGFYAQDAGVLQATGSLTPTSDLSAVALADVTGDGKLDVVGLLDGGVGIYRASCP